MSTLPTMLTTPRLVLRWWAESDAPALVVAQGFATEVARALTDAAFGQPHIDAVEIRHDRANSASRRVPERLGFELFLERRREPQAPGECGIECGWRIERPAWIRRGWCGSGVDGTADRVAVAGQ